MYTLNAHGDLKREVRILLERGRGENLIKPREQLEHKCIVERKAEKRRKNLQLAASDAEEDEQQLENRRR